MIFWLYYKRVDFFVGMKGNFGQIRAVSNQPNLHHGGRGWMNALTMNTLPTTIFKRQCT